MCFYWYFLNCFGFVFVGLFLLLCFLPIEVHIAFVCKAYLVVLNFLNFCLSGKLLISPANLSKGLAL